MGIASALVGAAVGAGVGSLAAIQFFRRKIGLNVKPPHPEWKVGENQPLPFGSDRMMTLDVAEMTGAQCYPLVISSVVPRPIAFVCSVSKDGRRNLAPYSYFGVMSHDPPHVCIGICASRSKPGGQKDTLRNILDTKEFTLSMMSDWFVESANHTCGEFDADVDELELVGLTPIPSVKVTPPRVKESAVHMECKLVHTYPVKNGSGAVTATIVVGEVLMFHVHEGVADSTPSGNTVVKIQPYRPVSRLGGNTYARVSRTFDLPRPDRSVK